MTTDTLDDLPTIDAGMLAAAPTAQPAAVAVIEPKTADLAKIGLTAVALAQYGDWRKDVAETKANLSTLALDLTTPTKIKEARALRQRLIGGPLAAVRKVAAGIKSKMAQTSKAVGAELEQIEAAYTEADALILPQIEKREQELEAERERARQAEAERKAKYEAAIDRIRAAAVRAGGPDMTAARISAGIAIVEAMPTPTADGWEEYAVPAANAICETLAKMRELHAKAVAAEAEAARREQERQENERRAAALAEQERQLAEQRAAVERERAELEAARALQVQQQSNGEAQLAKEEGQEAHQQEAGDSTAGADRARGSEQPAVAHEAAPPAGERISISVIERGAAALDAGSATVVEPVYVDPSDGSVHRFTPAPPADEKPTLKLGDINDWLGGVVSTSAAGLALLGIGRSGTDKAAKLYRIGDKARIKAALIEHLQGLR